MRKQKTFICCLLALIMMMTACGRENNSTKPEASDSPTSSSTVIEEELVDNKDSQPSKPTQPEETESTESNKETTTPTEDTERSEPNESTESIEKEETTTPTEKPEETKPTEPKPEETKPVQNPEPEKPKQPQNPIKLMSKIDSVQEFLKAPTQSDFGSQYENATKLYNAILNKEKSLTLTFEVGNCNEEQEAQIQFFKTFESKVLSNIFNITKTSYSGALTYTELNPSEIYDGIMMFNEYINAMKDMGINEYTETKDAVIKINDYLRQKLTYLSSSNNPYQALKTGKANCEGYARLFDRFCSAAGIETEYITGKVKDNGVYGLHAWNKVKIGSEWYYIDVCWNDSSRPNRYLLSKTLWDDHSTKLYIEVKEPAGVTSNNKVHFQNLSAITDLINEPNNELYGINTDAALMLYNAILNNEESVTIELYPENGETDLNKFYDSFQSLVQEHMFKGAFELRFTGISWKHNEGYIKATFNTKKMYSVMKEAFDYANEYHDANIAAGIKEGMNELEAIKKMVNWLANQTTYSSHHSQSTIEALRTKVMDYQWYALVFQQMCRDAGIECQIIKGTHPYMAYWNRVKVGDTWYYSDVWYYFSESYENYQTYEYFLSKNLWNTHTIKW